MSTLANQSAGGTGLAMVNQTWRIGPLSTVDFTLNADESGQLDFDTLSPALPKLAGDSTGNALSGTISFTCA